jgi:hypothetical protein
MLLTDPGRGRPQIGPVRAFGSPVAAVTVGGRSDAFRHGMIRCHRPEGELMYAVVTTGKIAAGRMDEVIGMTESQVIPMFRSPAGHLASYFTRSSDGASGLSVSLFESRQQAEASAATVVAPPGDPISVGSVEVREVIASA